jgi:hypothetical protein
MAAREDEPQPIIYDVRRVDRCLGDHLELGPADLAPGLAQPVDRLEPAGRDEPPARIRRRPFDGPALDRRGERVLQRLLGEIEIAEEADESSEDAARLGAVDGLDQVCDCENSMTGRTSTVPCFAPGMREATCTASFKSFAWIM